MIGTAALSGLDGIFDQFRFYGRILRSMPKALSHRGEIATLISDIALGAGALVIGGGMFFVVTSIAFFTGTEVGLEGFNGLQSLGGRRPMRTKSKYRSLPIGSRCSYWPVRSKYKPFM